ncbi:hypothetical protein AB0F77_20965 [Streptomyces sp. NPDC026672]|uniref:hypothetical protein n=1 Tax=unclassified Streptomyces TaxID=2593676 RepID=UPI0033F4B31C
MSGRPAEQAPTTTVGALPAAIEPSNLTVAIRVAHKMPADYGNSRLEDFSYPAAYGALSEALRILVRAVSPEAGERP